MSLAALPVRIQIIAMLASTFAVAFVWAAAYNWLKFGDICGQLRCLEADETSSGQIKCEDDRPR